MPITPRTLIPSTAPTPLATGPITSAGPGWAAVRVRPDLTVVAPVPESAKYAVGQLVLISNPGTGQPQILSPAAGHVGSVRHVHVPFNV